MKKLLLHSLAKPVIFSVCLMPLLWLIVGGFTDQLGANPAEYLVRATGDWTLRALCVVLALTPLRVELKLPAMARFRRMLGLFVFFYGGLHLLAYAWFDMGFEAGDIANDIAKRPFILVGFAGFLLLSLLATTSFNRAIKLLGGRRWQILHRCVYVIAGLALLHFFWMRAGKNNLKEVFIYTGIIAGLMGWRIWRKIVRQTAQVA